MNEILGVFGINWKLLLVQAFNFGVLLLALWYFLYRPVIVMLENRRQTIEKGVKDAERAEERLTEIDSERDEIITKATTEGSKIVGDAKVRGDEKASEIVGEANTRADSILSDAAARAQEAKERALRESKDEIASVAILAAEKVLRSKEKSQLN